MKKIILTASIAAALTLSCALPDESEDDSSSSSGNKSSSSDDGGDDNGGSTSGTTKTYVLSELGEDSFTFSVPYENVYCEEEGILETENDSYDRTIYYSIDDKILTWEPESNEYGSDTLLFKGTSSEPTGTWTRAKSSCLHTDEDGTWAYCKEDYDITKVVFTSTTVAITNNYCSTDQFINGEVDGEGWKVKIVDCNTREYSKGSNKITWKKTNTSEEVKYNNSTCKYSEPSKAKKQTACREAWALYIAYGEDSYMNWVDYYYNLLEGDGFYECLENILPEDWWPEGDYEGEDSDYYGKIAAKPAAKAKIKAKK